MDNLMNLKKHNLIYDLTLLKYDTIQTSAQIQKNRISDDSLQSMNFFTRDFAVYTKDKNKKPILNMVSDINLIFLDPESAFEDFRQTDNYMNIRSRIMPDPTSSPNNLLIELEGLKLRENYHGGYFNVNTKKYKSNLNSVQKLLVERLNGGGEDLEKVMDLYARNNHNTIIINVLTPEYVLDIFNRYYNAKFLGRLVVLDSINSEFKPSIDVRSMCYREETYLRGVPKHEGAKSGFEVYIDKYYS
jgi:hypothetical protein